MQDDEAQAIAVRNFDGSLESQSLPEREHGLDGIDENKISASFKNGVLTVTLPKSTTAMENVKRITINGK